MFIFTGIGSVIGVIWFFVIVFVIISNVVSAINKSNKNRSRRLREFEKKVEKKYNRNKVVKKYETKNSKDAEIKSESSISTRDYSYNLRKKYEEELYKDSYSMDAVVLEAEQKDLDPYFDPNFQVVEDSLEDINLNTTESDYNLKEAIILKEILDKPLSLRK